MAYAPPQQYLSVGYILWYLDRQDSGAPGSFIVRAFTHSAIGTRLRDALSTAADFS